MLQLVIDSDTFCILFLQDTSYCRQVVEKSNGVAKGMHNDESMQAITSMRANGKKGAPSHRAYTSNKVNQRAYFALKPCTD